jgi:hypothetical protein
VLDGTFAGTNLGLLDPANDQDRRILLTADHDGGSGKSATAEHLAEHLALTDRLWRGDPPELWETAQRLLDSGLERHIILHALMATLERVGHDRTALIAALDELEVD